MRIKTLAFAASLISSTALATISAAQAQSPITRQASFSIPAGDLVSALRAYSRQARVEVIFNAADMAGRKSGGVQGMVGTEAALRQLISGARVEMVRDPSGAYLIRPVGSLGFAPMQEAVQEARAPVYDEIIVTAQKKEERISDVPIAMTALSAQALDDYKIEGGSELLRAIPNVNFSKSNFSMYNFSIRGVGTKAISASSDPAVAISFNSTPLVRNRLFEAEFFDMERIEVLRGPQGTLYGRNATAGVVNLLPALPKADFSGDFKGEVGNYSTTRLSGMLNVPIADGVGVRVSGAWTKRDGFDYNSYSGTRVNGRDLWSARAIVALEPVESVRANLIWQRFEEDDNRSRTGKQLCTRDPGPEAVGAQRDISEKFRGRLSQGCLAGSLYEESAYGAPNGYSLVYVTVPQGINIGTAWNDGRANGSGGPQVYVVKNIDPYGNVKQSRNLREISTLYDPKFRAKNDVVQLNLEIDLSDGLKFNSQTAYSRDSFKSSQDYNRYLSDPIFNDSSQALRYGGVRVDPVVHPGPTPGGFRDDYQLGRHDRMLAIDLSHSESRQWSQEFRVQSDFGNKVNFNFGMNYLNFKTQDNYYVFNNMFTLLAEWFYSRNGLTNSILPCTTLVENRECPNVDNNSIDNLSGDGHNYFVSQNGVKVESKGIFGEVYYEISDSLNLTVGARYTDDKKRGDQVPSQLLLAGGSELEYPGDITGGSVNSGYPRLPDINQRWKKFTGRMVLDWKPDLKFSEDTLIYLSLARGYKGGGVNPPRVDFNPRIVQYQFLPQTFRPEFVNAVEIGAKNSMMGGRLTLNANAFLYDYKDYQISQIVDRIAYNENFDVLNWGLELEAAFRPSRAFRVDGNVGYLRTRIRDGEKSIDVMDRTQGDPAFMVVRPWLQVPSNCVAPTVFVERILQRGASEEALAALCPGASRLGTYDPNNLSERPGPLWYERYGFSYNPMNPYDPAKVGFDGDSGAPNGGRGHDVHLGGHELPNAPRWTANVGAQYKFFFQNDEWELAFRGDYYVQAKSFARVYNSKFDQLKSWSNFNMAVSLDYRPMDFSMQLYVKNVFNKSPITDFFLNSDDTGLTANVFTLDPRIVGFNVSKSF